MGDVAVTELTELDADKVAGVKTPANGTPFLLLKAQADKETCPTCDGSGKIKGGNVTCPDCKGSGEVAAKGKDGDDDEDEQDGAAAGEQEQAGDDDASKSDSDEADEQEKEMTGESDAAKGDVQDALDGTATPEVGGHLDSGNSGLAGSVTGDPKAPPADAALTVGGESSYEIPAEASVRDSEIPATTDALGLVNPQAMRKASVLAAFAATLEDIEAQQAAAKDGSFLTASPAPAAAPGSMPWESYDSATLAQVSECLAQCSKAVETIVKRELVEGDLGNAFELEGAVEAIQEALGIAALLSFHEKAEGEAATKSAETFAAKVGRVLSGKNLGSVESARDHLNAVIDGARAASAEDSHDEETDIMSTVTKEELSALFQEEADKALSKAMKRLAKRLEKNANNGGDISEGDIKPTRTVDAKNVNAVGGSVDSQYVNKEAEGASDAEAATQEDGALEKELAEVREQMESMQKSLDKIAKRPRAGGPLLTGQAAGLAAAAEGRMGEATKGEADDEIERLQKSLEATTDPVEREQLGLELSKARLTKLYEGRFVSC